MTSISFPHFRRFAPDAVRMALMLAAGLLAGTMPAHAGIPGVTTNILLPGTPFATPCYTIAAAKPGPTVLVVGGVHGNEPAGAEAAEAIRQWQIQSGQLIVIPRANVTGLAANKRRIQGLDTNLSDLNRDYPKAKQADNEARGDLAQSIWKIATENKVDWVLDLHEGYDFHQLNEKSVGSSIICFPLTNGQAAADAMLAAVNATITNAPLQFVRRNMPIDGSLARAAGEHLQVPGMTVETTDKQPMALRVGQQETIVRALLTRLDMLPAGVPHFSERMAEEPTLGSPMTAKPIRVALYKGPGTGGKGPPELLKALAATNGVTSIAEVGPKDIQSGVLTNFDVVIFAGGSGSQEGKAIGETGCKQVEQFIARGGGYVGICAGAYLATSGYPWSLHVINAHTLSPKWARGRAVLKMELSPAGEAIIGGSTNLDVMYHQGPVVGPANAPELPPYQTLAWFRTEVASNNTPVGIMVNSPAIFASEYKKGRVICISPHPEQTPGLEYIVPRAVNWVAATKRGE